MCGGGRVCARMRACMCACVNVCMHARVHVRAFACVYVTVCARFPHTFAVACLWMRSRVCGGGGGGGGGDGIAGGNE